MTKIDQATSLATADVPQNSTGPGTSLTSASEPAPDQGFAGAGVALCRRRRFAEAAVVFADQVTAHPGDAKAWLALARCALMAGEQVQARRACDRALELDPTLVRAHLVSARLAGLAQNDRARILALKAAADLLPAAVALRLRLVDLMLCRTQFRAAMAVAREAQAVAPDDLDTILAVARCHIGLAQFGLAKLIMDKLTAAGRDGEGLRRLRDMMLARQSQIGDLSAAASIVQMAPSKPNIAEEAGKPAGVVTREARRDGEVPGARPANDIQALPASDVQAFREPAPSPGGADPAEARRRVMEPEAAPGRGGTAEAAGSDRSTARRLASRKPRPRSGLIDHLLIIRALILRDLRIHYRDSRFGALAELLRPTAVVIAHYWLFYFLRKPMPAEVSIAVYVLAGFSIWFAFSGSWSAAEGAGKWPGGATLLPGVTDLHLRIAKALWKLLLNFVFCVLALVPLIVYGQDLPLPNLPQTCLLFGIAGCMGFAVGLIVECLSHIVPFFKAVAKLLNWAMFVSCGLYFTIETMPPVVANVFWYNPVLHLVDYERQAFDPGYPVFLLNLFYPAGMSVTLLTLSLLMYKKMSKPVHE